MNFAARSILRNVLRRRLKPAIVVVGFNRPTCIERLLNGLLAADYADYDQVPLILSIDGGGDPSVRAHAERFVWTAGPLRVIAHKTNLGLRDHILFCGDLVREYGSVILLEDDLMVSPHFYSFAASAADFYQDHPRIAGIALYSFGYNEFSGTVFSACDDGRAVYFLQSTCSSGQCWTAQQWENFRAWYKDHPTQNYLSSFQPSAVLEWPESSWKKYFNSFLQQTGRYFAVPRRSYSTNMGDAGTHFGRPVSRLTVPLTIGEASHEFPPFEHSLCRYDPFFEIETDCLQALCPDLPATRFSVDLYGTKTNDQMPDEYALTIKPSSTPPLASFGLRYLPPELNVILRHPGNFISLARVSDLKPLPKPRLRRLRRFFNC